MDKQSRCSDWYKDTWKYLHLNLSPYCIPTMSPLNNVGGAPLITFNNTLVTSDNLFQITFNKPLDWHQAEIYALQQLWAIPTAMLMLLITSMSRWIQISKCICWIIQCNHFAKHQWAYNCWTEKHGICVPWIWILMFTLPAFHQALSPPRSCLLASLSLCKLWKLKMKVKLSWMIPALVLRLRL